MSLSVPLGGLRVLEIKFFDSECKSIKCESIESTMFKTTDGKYAHMFEEQIPTYTEYFPDGKIKKQVYMNPEGLLHCSEIEPVVIEYHADGWKESVMYNYENGSRLICEYYADGRKKKDIHYSDSTLSAPSHITEYP